MVSKVCAWCWRDGRREGPRGRASRDVSTACRDGPARIAATIDVWKLEQKQIVKKTMCFLLLALAGPLRAEVPALPLMTLYRFNGDLEMPYYEVEKFRRSGPSVPAGTLAQGTSVVPCLVIWDGKPLTDGSGTPYVGFRVVVDSRSATPRSTQAFISAKAEREGMTARNHHCAPDVRYVIDVRNLYELNKPPFFDPPRSSRGGQPGSGPAAKLGVLDEIIRAFHTSRDCRELGRSLVGRRDALAHAWSRFAADGGARWKASDLERARHLDYVLRTAMFEGHLDRGCSAYGACERNIVALSIRNRARESCRERQGCSQPGDFQGVASKVSQYNIWDEFLTQIAGLTSCFLRSDLGIGVYTTDGKDSPKAAYYDKLESLYSQNFSASERLLFGDDGDLAELFPGNSLDDLKALRHYYHAPAMGKCFPNEPRVEYMSGAVARKGDDYILLANTRIKVDGKAEGGYFFRGFLVHPEQDRDRTELVDSFRGFVVDGRKVDLKPASRCLAYGIPSGCPFREIGRYRKTPSWLNAGKPLEIACSIRARGAQCDRSPGATTVVRVGGTCDKEMRPVAGVR